MRKLVAFIRLTRPFFLGGGVVLFWVGSRLTPGSPNVGDYLIAQGMVTSIQLFAQYVNEHFDRETDAHPETKRTILTGGSGVLAAGTLGPRVAIRAAVVAAWASLALGAAAATIDWRLPVIGAAALAGSWWYSAPPNRLVGSGLGELEATVIVAVLVPLTGAVTAGGPDWRLFTAVITMLAPAHLAMLISFSAPDAAADDATGKRTLFVRLGRERALALHLALVGGCGVAIAAGAEWRPTAVTVAAAIAIPIGLAAHGALRRSTGSWGPTPSVMLAVGWFAVLAIAVGAAL